MGHLSIRNCVSQFLVLCVCLCVLLILCLRRTLTNLIQLHFNTYRGSITYYHFFMFEKIHNVVQWSPLFSPRALSFAWKESPYTLAGTSHINGIVPHVISCLASFTWRGVFRVHLCCSMNQDFIPSYYWKIWQCMDIPHCVYLSVDQHQVVSTFDCCE